MFDMRTKGATSCVTIKLKELAARFGPEADIVISRKFAQANNLPAVAFVSTAINVGAAAVITAAEPEDAEQPIEAVEAVEGV